MIIFIKCAVGIIFIFKTVSMQSLAVSSLIIPACLLMAALHLKIHIRIFLRRNYFIFVFMIMFSAFTFLSQLITHQVNPRALVLVLYKIIIIYNIIYICSSWIGKNGFLLFVNLLPGQRLKMFLILFYRFAFALLKTNRQILFALKSRMDFSLRNRLIIVRYYIQNLLTKELYALRYYQASLYTRLTYVPALHCQRVSFSVFECLLFSIAVLYCIIDFVM